MAVFVRVKVRCFKAESVSPHICNSTRSLTTKYNMFLSYLFLYTHWRKNSLILQTNCLFTL